MVRLGGNVATTGAQTIAGAKTFVTVPKSSEDASAAIDLVRKSQLDAGLATKAALAHAHVVSDVTGLQSALIIGNLGSHLGFVSGASLTDTPARCTTLPDVAAGQNRLQNGIQIFPGSVPIYRGNVLVGAIGVSGDGIDQDDMIAFLGVNNAAIRVGGFRQADVAIRSDQIVVTHPGGTTRLRYVSCPFAPFLDSSQQNVCSAP